MKRIHCIVRGRVQGVGYRASAQREAQRLGLAGWVRNLPDDTVEFSAEGEQARLEELISWARRGPRMAVVTGLDVKWGHPEGATSFTIRY